MQGIMEPDGKRVVSGDVCLVHISIQSTDDSIDLQPWAIFADRESLLREEFVGIIRHTLGPEFHMRAMTVGRGSIELLVLVGTAYYAVSRYKNFVESIELMVDQMRNLADRLLARQSRATASASWTPLPPLLGASRFPSLPSASEVAPLALSRLDLLTWYLVLTNAAMLSVLVWFLIQSVQ